MSLKEPAFLVHQRSGRLCFPTLPVMEKPAEGGPGHLPAEARARQEGEATQESQVRPGCAAHAARRVEHERGGPEGGARVQGAGAGERVSGMTECMCTDLDSRLETRLACR